MENTVNEIKFTKPIAIAPYQDWLLRHGIHIGNVELIPTQWILSHLAVQEVRRMRVHPGIEVPPNITPIDTTLQILDIPSSVIPPNGLTPWLAELPYSDAVERTAQLTKVELDKLARAYRYRTGGARRTVELICGNYIQFVNLERFEDINLIIKSLLFRLKSQAPTSAWNFRQETYDLLEQTRRKHPNDLLQFDSKTMQETYYLPVEQLQPEHYSLQAPRINELPVDLREPAIVASALLQWGDPYVRSLIPPMRAHLERRRQQNWVRIKMRK